MNKRSEHLFPWPMKTCSSWLGLQTVRSNFAYVPPNTCTPWEHLCFLLCSTHQRRLLIFYLIFKPSCEYLFWNKEKVGGSLCIVKLIIHLVSRLQGRTWVLHWTWGQAPSRFSQGTRWTVWCCRTDPSVAFFKKNY